MFLLMLEQQLQKGTLPKDYKIQVHLKKLEYHEKGYYFLSLISESETHILYRCITHRVKYFKPLFLEILTIMAYREWKPKIQCLRKLEYYIRSIKDILNRNVRLLKSMFISIHSILVWASLAWITASMRRGMETIGLWHCSGVMKHRLLW